MWPALMVAARTYAPFVVFPFAFIIGAIGYSIEGISTLFIPDKPFKSPFQLKPNCFKKQSSLSSFLLT